MLAVIYLFLSLLLLFCVIGVISPRTLGSTLGMVFAVPFIVVALFIPQIIAVGLLTTVLCLYFGVQHELAGQLGLFIHLMAWALLGWHLWQMRTTYPLLNGEVLMDDAPVFGAKDAAHTSYGPMLRYRTAAMQEVEVTRNVVFREVGGVRLLVDVYRPRQRADAAAAQDKKLPSLIYIHGGAWIVGTRRQSRFMMFELAKAGYVVFAVSYRLAPRFPMPLGIEDCKSSVVWVREHAHEYGGTADAVVLGGSAGGHLTAMMALTANDPRFQTGFEDRDTHVRGAVIFYGLPEFTSLLDTGSALARWLIERVVFRKRFRDDRELFRLSQPTSYLSSSAPPILLIHGQNDSLIPIEASRSFAEQLRKAGAARVELCEIPRAQHAFEISPTLLYQRTMRVVLGFLASLTPPGAAKPDVTPPSAQ